MNRSSQPVKQPLQDAKTRKAEIRSTVLERRRSMAESDAAALSRVICRRLADIRLLSEARCVHAFWPIHEKREVDLRPLLRSWVDEGRIVVLPVVGRRRPGTPVRLEHRRFTLDDHLVVSDLGIAEPISGDAVDIADIDAVIVPALSVDSEGFRIGYGMGYYDRFLNDADAVRICPIYDMDVAVDLPREEHDQPVDIVVTEHRTMTLRRT